MKACCAQNERNKYKEKKKPNVLKKETQKTN